MTRFLRTPPQKGTFCMIVIEKQCISDENHPSGWARLKKPLFKSRKQGRESYAECFKVMEKFVFSRSCCMANTLYRYRIIWVPGDDNGDMIHLRCSDERITLPKGFRVAELVAKQHKRAFSEIGE